MGQIPTAPKGLSAEARRMWRLYNNGWSLDEHSQVVLRLALEGHDRMRAAPREIRTHGLVLAGGKVNPAVLVERDCRRDVSKLLRALGLALTPPSTVGR